VPQFEIDVTRVGVGFATISVEADSLQDAQQRALDEAGNHEFSEKASEYELTHGGPAEGAGRALVDVSSDDLVEELRRRGVAVCAFTSRDLVERGRGLDEETSAGVLRPTSCGWASTSPGTWRWMPWTLETTRLEAVGSCCGRPWPRSANAPPGTSSSSGTPESAGRC
jgi:hypothetical protein